MKLNVTKSHADESKFISKYDIFSPKKIIFIFIDEIFQLLLFSGSVRIIFSILICPLIVNIKKFFNSQNSK